MRSRRVFAILLEHNVFCCSRVEFLSLIESSFGILPFSWVTLVYSPTRVQPVVQSNKMLCPAHLLNYVGAYNSHFFLLKVLRNSCIASSHGKLQRIHTGQVPLSSSVPYREETPSRWQTFPDASHASEQMGKLIPKVSFNSSPLFGHVSLMFLWALAKSYLLPVSIIIKI